MNCWPWTFLMLSLAAFQLWVWPSIIKISSPLLVRYIAVSSQALERSVFDVFQRLLHVTEQYHGVVVNHHHATIMGGSADFEQIRRHLAPQGFGNLGHLEGDLAFAIDADH